MASFVHFVVCRTVMPAVLIAWAGLAAAHEPAPRIERTAPLGPVIDARPGAGEVLDLAACVGEALQANDQLRAERLRRAELDGKMKQALSTGLPTLDLSGDWSRGRNPSFALDSTFGGSGSDGDGGGGAFGGFPGADPWFNDWVQGFGSFIPSAEEIQAQTFWNTSANLNWTINPMLILGAVGAARLGIDQQNLNVEAVEQSTTDQILTAYYAIIKSAEKINAVRAELANQTELLDILKLRQQLGMATRLDTLQAAVGRANILPRVSIAEARLRNDGSRLNALMGRSPEAPLSISNDQHLENEPLRDEVALALVVSRPDLAATGLFVDILRRNRQAQVSDNRPYLTVFGSYGYVGSTFETVFDRGHDSWRASVALNIPIFDGLNTRGRVAETDARIRRTEAELSGRQRAAQVEVLGVLADLRMARQVLSAADLNLERSEDVLDESLMMLELGKVDYLNVLVAEANRAEANSNVIGARYEVLVLTSTLKRSIGYSPLLPLTGIPNLTGETTP